MSLKRILKELDDIQKNSPDNICAKPTKENNLLEWDASIKGPENTPYSGGVFVLKIYIPTNYPFAPPNVKFVTKIYHPNIRCTTGEICLDILKEAWSPALSIMKILLSLSSLLMDPNPNSPLEGAAANLYLTNREQYNKNVKEWVEKYALPK